MISREDIVMYDVKLGADTQLNIFHMSQEMVRARFFV